jgi:hypothetical protein
VLSQGYLLIVEEEDTFLETELRVLLRWEGLQWSTLSHFSIENMLGIHPMVQSMANRRHHWESRPYRPFLRQTEYSPVPCALKALMLEQPPEGKTIVEVDGQAEIGHKAANRALTYILFRSALLCWQFCLTVYRFGKR